MMGTINGGCGEGRDRIQHDWWTMGQKRTTMAWEGDDGKWVRKE
jgi:hypothetical protein